MLATLPGAAVGVVCLIHRCLTAILLCCLSVPVHAAKNMFGCVKRHRCSFVTVFHGDPPEASAVWP